MNPFELLFELTQLEIKVIWLFPCFLCSYALWVLINDYKGGRNENIKHTFRQRRLRKVE